MINQKLFFFVLFCKIFLTNSEPCTIPLTGLEGNCVPLAQCPSVQEEIRTDKKKTPVICNRRLRTICCPITPLIERNSFDSEGLPEVHSHSINRPNNQQFTHLDEACIKYRGRMKKNLTISSFIIGEPEAYQMIGFCNTNKNDIGVAVEKEFPHITYIVGKPEQPLPESKCLGSLITEKFVLTTALCVNYIRHSSATVYFGVLNLTTEFQAYDHVVVYRHSIYSLEDITLLQLPKVMEISENIFPTCLSTFSNDKFVLTGWTGYRFDCNPVLKKWYIESDEVGACGKKKLCFNSTNIVNYHETLLPGSPLQVYHPDSNCQYVVKGLFVRIFKEKYEFVSIQKYLPWIQTIIKQ